MKPFKFCPRLGRPARVPRAARSQRSRGPVSSSSSGIPPTAPSFPDLTRLLAPASIAVVGASDQPGNLGGVAIRFLRKFGFPGDVLPVNPKRSEVHGLRCVPRLSELPPGVDLAVLATGAESTPALVRECGAAGIPFAVIWAGGFAEVGGRGRELQDELVTACREAGVAVVGPNCIGIINSWLPATASFASFLLETDSLLRGNISVVSQSGGLATMAQALAQRAGIGFRYMISAGNEATLTLADFIHALARDPQTKVIAVYLEGVRDGERFLASLAAAREAGKPVVVLKGGDTAASARAAAAHTGALAGEGRVWDAVFRELAAIRVQSLEELLDVSLYLSTSDLTKLPKGPGIAPVTTGGGIGVLSADQCARHGLVTPLLAAETRAALRALAPPIAAVDNPIDLTPTVYNQAEWFAKFGRCLDTIAADPGIDAVLVQFGPMGLRGLEVARELVDFRRRCPKAVCLAWPLAPQGVPEHLRGEGIHVFDEYARAIAVLGKLARHGADLAIRACAPAPPVAFDWQAHTGPTPSGTVISEHECHRILAAGGIAVAEGRLATSADDAVRAAMKVGLPVAMKGISAKVTHRAAAGLVALDLGTEAALRETYARLRDTARAGGIELDGVYVQHMVRAGVEILVSALRDPVAGVMISCGAGGALTEVIDDVALARAPLDRDGARLLLRRLRLVAGLERGGKAPPIDLLADFVARFSAIAAVAPWRRFVIELNPVKWSAKGVTAVDGLLIIEEC
ncbi:MAG: acetate--CoA ligase family protein [Alphaproteobacteria bacterium]|nr:acetate--CoA ligase family protein [Alphaproteobacteria bacterium]